ncbi:MAG: DUF3570 domain-containing protein [Deltaproteobacteria bacterium]|nr:DUF3570 domain-containing protein [Deltaproteobacteria bacterium]
MQLTQRLYFTVFAALLVLLPLGTAQSADGLEEHRALNRKDGDSLEAKTEAPLGTRVAGKLVVYEDNDGLTVVTPIVSVTQKIFDTTSLTAEYDADVLTAATVDVRTAATQKFEEVRHGLAVSAIHRLRDLETDLSGSVSLSREADYASATFGGGVSSDFLDKNFTLGGGYAYVLNAVGRSHTPYDNFLDRLHIHALSVSATQLLSPQAYLQISGSGIGAFGYQGSVYRYVPLFLDGQVDQAQVDEANLESGAVRPVLRPAEQVPRERWRGAIVGRLNYAFDFGLTVAPDYRFYADSWGVTSHTVDLVAHQHLPAGLVLRARSRFYAQQAATFYQRVYLIENVDVLPLHYTTDRELGTYWYELVGLKLSWELPNFGAFESLVLDVKGDLQYTRYADFAYLPNRTAFMVGGGFVVEL